MLDCYQAIKLCKMLNKSSYMAKKVLTLEKYNPTVQFDDYANAHSFIKTNTVMIKFM